jgi:hypothetical protein
MCGETATKWNKHGLKIFGELFIIYEFDITYWRITRCIFMYFVTPTTPDAVLLKQKIKINDQCGLECGEA